MSDTTRALILIVAVALVGVGLAVLLSGGC